MDAFLLGAAGACWLGILTSISPCPLATNIAAISYVGKRVDSPLMVLLTGLLYMLGRMLVYLVLGILIVASLLSVPDLSYFLQENINKFLGPILVVAGLLLLRVLRMSAGGSGAGEKLRKRVEAWGVWGALLLGIVFALSFCPISAALFFGSLIPLAVKHESTLVLPSLYGLGTALPVLVFAVLISLGAGYVGRVFNRLTQFELWARRLTGVVFLVVGAYFIMVYILGFDW
ncbi:MAG: aromatic aminobenezylarsenical efflux permease ArsG family transporter [candidate division Zixibacteria bacterium]|nr:aromatic aminobenezylarsenical efflux permease ArsG family transporter [candidate division Zixibacteria bacterium]